MLATVTDETVFDSGSLVFDVDVYFMTQELLVTATPDGIQPPTPDFGGVYPFYTSTVWVMGLIVEAGDLLSPDPDGSIPFDYNGSLVVTDAIVINGNLFDYS